MWPSGRAAVEVRRVALDDDFVIAMLFDRLIDFVPLPGAD
jgi:hypothetical protein